MTKKQRKTKTEKFEIGDLAIGMACRFVVEKQDLSTMHNPSNDHYELLHTKFRGDPDHYMGYHAHDHITLPVPGIIGKLLSRKKEYYVMRDPENGRFVGLGSGPHCVPCNKNRVYLDTVLHND